MGQGDYPERMREPHPLSNKTIRIKSGEFKGELFWVEDWQINVYGGQSWAIATGNMAALDYAMRLTTDQVIHDADNKDLTDDDEVVYGKLGPNFIYSKMLHVSQIGEVICDGRPSKSV